jgi:hypothetical protein
MKTLKNLLVTLAVLAAFPFLGLAQLATQSTTLTAALSQPSTNTVPGQYDTVYVASTTGMLGPVFSGNSSAPQTWLYINKEAMPVFNVVNTTTVQVLRGASAQNLGTNSSPHISGATVLFGPYGNFVQGNSLGQAASLGGDPSGSCVSAVYQYLPLINAQNGHLVNCDSVTSTAQVWALTGQSAFVSASTCGFLATTTAITDDGMVVLAAGNLIRKLVTNTTAGTTNFDCVISPASVGLANGNGIIVTSVSFIYGVQGTGGLYTSTVAPILDSITYAVPGGTAKGTVATAACGTLTQTPASLVTAVTSSGVYNTVSEACGTPWFGNTADQVLVFDIVLGNSTTALTYQIPGLIVYYDQPT